MLKKLLLPAVDPSNPLFMLEFRRLKWGNAAKHFMRFSLRVLLVLFGLFIAFTLLLAAASYPYRLQWLLQSYAAFGFVISIGAGLFIDLVSMTFTITRISGEINAKHWDLVRLSLLDRQSIIASKHSIATIRAWRMMGFVLILRCLVTACFFASMFIPYSPTSPPPIIDMLTSAMRSPIEAVFVIAIAVTFFSIYIIEPKWRMYAQTAAGLAISARVRNPLFATLTALAYIVIIWIAQAIIIGLYGWFTVMFTVGIQILIAALCVVFMACGFTALTVRAFYKGLQGWALDYAHYHAFKDD